MRITGGRYGGRIVQVPPGDIRPAMDRMRESLFSILGDLSGCSFLDLFAGSGIMSLEALSRGATRATLVERDSKKRATILRNLSLADEPTRLIIAPVERFLARAKERWDLIHLDPPFAYRFKEDLILRIARAGLLAEAGRLMIHYPASESLAESIGGYTQADQRRYGGSLLRIYR